MAAGAKKKAFIVDVIRKCQSLVSVLDDLQDIEGEYFDNGYNSGGADAVADADLGIHDMTAAQFSGLITVVQQLQKWGNAGTGQIVADYVSSLNMARRAPGV